MKQKLVKKQHLKWGASRILQVIPIGMAYERQALCGESSARVHARLTWSSDFLACKCTGYTCLIEGH